MFRNRRRVPLYTHQMEQDYSNRILRIRTQLELYNDLKQISEDLPNNPQIMQLKMITQKKIIEDISVLQKTGFDITSLIATFGVKLLKAEIIDAESTIAAKATIDSSDAGTIVDLIAEDKILVKRGGILVMPRAARAAKIAPILARRAPKRSSSAGGIAPVSRSLAPIPGSIIPPVLGAPVLGAPIPVSSAIIPPSSPVLGGPAHLRSLSPPAAIIGDPDIDEEVKMSAAMTDFINDSELDKYTIRKDDIAINIGLMRDPVSGQYLVNKTNATLYRIDQYVQQKTDAGEPINLSIISWAVKNSSKLYNDFKALDKEEYKTLIANDPDSRMQHIHKYLNKKLLVDNGLPPSTYKDFSESADPGSFFLDIINSSVPSRGVSTMATSRPVTPIVDPKKKKRGAKK